MGTKSWVVTIIPLILAIASFAKAYFFGNDLSDQEVQILEFLTNTAITWFIGSGTIGAANSIVKKLKA